MVQGSDSVREVLGSTEPAVGCMKESNSQAIKGGGVLVAKVRMKLAAQRCLGLWKRRLQIVVLCSSAVLYRIH